MPLSAADTPPHSHRASLLQAVDAEHRDALSTRWDAHGERLVRTLHGLYGNRPGHDAWLTRLLQAVAACAQARPSALRALDAQRERDPRWFLAPDLIGYSAYVDRFAGTLRGVAEKVPYLQRLGVRYLHLLPFQQAREGDNDGGFAVRDYDAIDPALGTLRDLETLTARLRQAGISLCADFVLNHTADDHRWAQAASAGDPRYRAYYHAFPDRALPDRFERTLGQVFPQTAPGNFTHVPGLGWVWTTFYPYQWDLDWSNPDVFADMALTLLRLANRGIEAFRLDSTAYLWKREGTDSMNQPEAHAILQALRALADLVAPGVLLKAEAIVPARELTPYFGSGDAAGHECHLAYHSTLMAAAWTALAEQRGDILTQVIEQTPALPAHCAWLGYVRCHDDIGWKVLADEATGKRGGAPFELNRIARFYAGDTPDSYARGRAFQSAGSDDAHGSNGMASALAGIAAAVETGDAHALALAQRRLLLLYGIAFSVAALPLIYMGDELGLGNDEDYARDPRHASEGRWLHRPLMDWNAANADGDDTSGNIGRAIRRMIAVRRETPALAADASMRALGFADPALFGLARGEGFVALFNMSARTQIIDSLRGFDTAHWQDLLQDERIELPIVLEPYAMRWLRMR
jgi:amylosucrase